MESPESKKEKSIFWQAVGLAFQFGYTITIPLVILVLLGRFLDKKFDSSPIFILTGIIISMIISGIALVLKMKKSLAKEYEKAEEEIIEIKKGFLEVKPNQVVILAEI